LVVKIKFASPAAGAGSLGRKLLLGAGLAVAACFVIFACVFGFYYVKYSKIVDQRLEKPLFTATAKIYAAPAELRPRQKFTAHYIAQQLRNAGY
jgi:penicillin-binding protein 1B